MNKSNIIVIGASGKIGSEVAAQLSASHKVIRVGRTTGDYRCDYTKANDVRDLFSQVDELHGIVVAAGGDSVFKGYGSLVDDDYRFGFERKFLAQTRIARMAEDVLVDGGSITLSSGFLSDYPFPASLATGPFNAAVDAFVFAAAPLLPRGLRLNVVSPAPVVDGEVSDRGTVTAEEAAAEYVRAVDGDFSGRVLRPWGGLPVVER